MGYDGIWSLALRKTTAAKATVTDPQWFSCSFLSPSKLLNQTSSIT